MALMDDLRTKLAAIGDAIRGKTGGSAGLTLDDMVAAINGISTGSSGGSGGGSDSGSNTNAIEGGYTVNFYNTDETLIETHSALLGNWVDAPISYDVHHWENADGYMNQFPLTVTEDDTETVFDLHPVVIGENAVYLINPNGTDFASTFLTAEGTAQSGYTDNQGNGGFSANYTENAYKFNLAPTSGASRFGKLTFNDPVNCEGYKYLKLKWFYTSVWTAGSDSGSFHISLSKDVDSTSKYKTTQINNRYTNYGGAYYIARTGDQSWTEESTLNDLSNPGWHWLVIDISDLTEFYLTFEGNYYNSYVAELIMTM